MKYDRRLITVLIKDDKKENEEETFIFYFKCFVGAIIILFIIALVLKI